MITIPAYLMHTYKLQKYTMFYRSPQFWGEWDSGAQAVLSAPALIALDSLGMRLLWDPQSNIFGDKRQERSVSQMTLLSWFN